MLKFDKWYMPEGETHLPEWMRRADKKVNGRLSYQYLKYEASLPYVKNRRAAIDVGSHIGLWAYHMAHDFQNIHCFEPVKEHRECWELNMQSLNNATLYPCALGAKEQKVDIRSRTEGSSGDSQVIGEGEIPMITLDSLKLQEIDLIKIDCEGYELEVLKGAIDTVKEFEPVIIVEQKGDMICKYGSKKLGAVIFLEDMGYKIAKVISGDYIMVK